jgi:hypothetical protein
VLARREGLIPITCGSNVPQELRNTLLTPINEQPIARSAMPLATAAPIRARLCAKKRLNVSERSLVNVYCFSLFFGENVEQAKEMLMDLTISREGFRPSDSDMDQSTPSFWREVVLLFGNNFFFGEHIWEF